MSEFVEFRCEEWVSELEKLEKIRLFEPKEIKTLATRLREFEYKLERKFKYKEDFLRYIQFEVDLLRLIILKRKKTGIKSNKAEIEQKLMQKIIRLFKQLIFRHPSDVKLWMSLFEFCIEFKEKVVISKMLVRLLQFHSDKPDLWIYASKWELSYGKSFENARQYLMKALRHHPSSDQIYLELLTLELKYMHHMEKLMNKKLKRKKIEIDEKTKSILKGKLIEITYKSAISVIKSADFKVEFLKIVRQNNSNIDLEDMILNDLIKQNIEEEITWHTLAKRAFKGLKCDFGQLLENDEIEKFDENLDNNEKNDFESRLNKCISIYEKAVKRLNTSKMWDYYLSHIINIYSISIQKPNFPLANSPIFKNAVQGALFSGHLTEKHLLQWINLFKKSICKNEYLEDILLKATQIYPNSLSLWHARIRYYLSHDDEKTGRAVFEEAIKQVIQNKSLWDLVMQYYLLKNSAQIEDFFKMGLDNGGEVAQIVKPFYLEWLVSKKGLEEARKVYETIDFKHPPCLELYQLILKLELEQNNVDIKQVRKCHELIISYFGHDNPNVWLDFVKWEIEMGNVAEIPKIYRRALNTLNSQKVENFIAEYNTIKMKSS